MTDGVSTLIPASAHHQPLGSEASIPARSPTSERCGVGQVCEQSPPDCRTLPLTDTNIRAGWVELLSRYRWDVFATLTYGGSAWCDEKVCKNFNHWLFRWQETTAIERGLCTVEPGKPNPRHGGYSRPKRRGTWWNNYRKHRARPTYVLGIEPQRSGKLHAHAIIKWSNLLPDLEKHLGWRLWFEPRNKGGLGFGFAKLEPPRCQGDVADYVAKYVTKGGEIVLSPSFDASRLVAA